MKEEKNSVASESQAKPQETRSARSKKNIKQIENVRLPFLIELTYTLSALILILLGFAIMITSLLAGVGLFTVILRTSVAVMLMGGLLMVISSQISSGLLFSVKVEQEEEQRKKEESAAQMISEDLDKVEA